MQYWGQFSKTLTLAEPLHAGLLVYMPTQKATQ